MRYSETVNAVFLSRPNRFIAFVDLEGVTTQVHVKNTGRCRELLIPGARVILEKAKKGNRKTAYDLIAVYKDGMGWINIDSQAPNNVMHEWLLKQNYDLVKPEYSCGNSRFDFYMEKGDERYLMEVKGCTLEIDGKGYFPDAPTLRGTRHLRELAFLVNQGYKCTAAFVIQMEGIDEVIPNAGTDPEFAAAFFAAKEAGVEIRFFRCRVGQCELEIIE